jgi:cbb3-type cytochrome oxidase cytochrome c subunit
MKSVQAIIEKNIGGMVVLIVLVTCGLVEIVPLYFQNSRLRACRGRKPYPPLQPSVATSIFRKGALPVARR